jgi:flagellar hook-basal body complex protein FliE
MMSGITKSIGYASGIHAYKSRLKQNQTIRKSVGDEAKELKGVGHSVLRKGDDINLNKIPNSATTSAANSSKFSNMLHDSIQKNANTVRKAERFTKHAVRSKANLVEVMNAVNESELALQQVVAVRDRFLTAIQDILKMPI